MERGIGSDQVSNSCLENVRIRGDYPFGSSDALTQGLQGSWNFSLEAPIVTSHSGDNVGHQIPTKNQVNKEKVDPRTRRKTLESSIQVTREERDEYYGTDGYWCECTAWNNVQGSDQPQKY
ncbi:hypothetical protein Btru_021782 [Bulinus truncatus]|nr:hypothetical protein Btru_021782 [Bulinus truncatus]